MPSPGAPCRDPALSRAAVPRTSAGAPAPLPPRTAARPPDLFQGEPMLAKIRQAVRNENGFTLIELLMVIVILGILSGIVVFAVGGITDKGQTSACKATITTVE